ncbi:MAG TPA: hypothetical protein DCX79_15020 [Planctomycetaceae bacterium]|nr:hypothetical protein [Planctomycetaceae bacterium]
MLKFMLASGMVLGGAAVGLYCYSPALRAVVNQTAAQATGWTESARQADPAGYIEYVRRQLRDDLAAIRDSRAQLQSEQERLNALQQTRQQQLTSSGRLLSGFRSAWQTGEFPVVVLGQSYSSEQLQSQVALLLEEQTGYEASLQRIREAQEASTERLRELTVQLETIGTSLSLLDTQKELLISERLETSGGQLVAGVDALLNHNQELLSVGPVRPLDDLVAAEGTPAVAGSRSMARVLEYLRNGLPDAGVAGLTSAAIR